MESQYYFLSIIRVIIYLWIGVEFSNLTYLYYVGYKKFKPTPIIKALQIMFLSLSVLSYTLAFLPILLELNGKVHYIVVTTLPIILIPVGIVARRFRLESLRKQTMKLPSDKKSK